MITSIRIIRNIFIVVFEDNGRVVKGRSAIDDGGHGVNREHEHIFIFSGSFIPPH